MLKPGINAQASAKVTMSNTAMEVGSGTVPVFATPMLVALMEKAAISSLADLLPPDQTSVGTKIDMVHTAATPVGLSVTAGAVLKEVDGRRLVFEVTAADEAGPVASGIHERFIVNREKFLSKAQEKLLKTTD